MNRHLNFRTSPAAIPPIPFDENDPGAALRLRPRPAGIPPSVVAAPPDRSLTKISGLRTAYVRRKASGVIETLSLRKRVFYPLLDNAGVFGAPDHAHVVLLADDKVQPATLYVRNRSRWVALKGAPGRSSNADFLTPIHHADVHTANNAMQARIVANAAMDPQTAIHRNGDAYFFNATMLLLLREARITLPAADSVYLELAVHVHRAAFRTATLDHQFVNFAFLLWLAMAIRRPLTLPRIADIPTDYALELYYSAVNAVLADPALMFVPSTLYAVLHDNAAGTVLSSTVRIEVARRQYELQLAVQNEQKLLRIEIRQDQLRANTLVPLLGKRTINIVTAGQDEKLFFEYIQQHMVEANPANALETRSANGLEALSDLDDFGVGVVEDRYVLYIRTGSADAYRWKTL